MATTPGASLTGDQAHRPSTSPGVGAGARRRPRRGLLGEQLQAHLALGCEPVRHVTAVTRSALRLKGWQASRVGGRLAAPAAVRTPGGR